MIPNILEKSKQKISEICRQYKIRELSLQKTPYILVVGKREAEEGTVALRKLGGETQEILALDQVIDKLSKEAIAPHKRVKE